MSNGPQGTIPMLTCPALSSGSQECCLLLIMFYFLLRFMKHRNVQFSGNHNRYYIIPTCFIVNFKVQGYDHICGRWSAKKNKIKKKHANPSYKATKHIERTFPNLEGHVLKLGTPEHQILRCCFVLQTRCTWVLRCSWFQYMQYLIITSFRLTEDLSQSILRLAKQNNSLCIGKTQSCEQK